MPDRKEATSSQTESSMRRRRTDQAALPALPEPFIECPIRTMAKQLDNDQEIRAYKLGKKRWSYNQCEIKLLNDLTGEKLEVVDCMQYGAQTLTPTEQESGVTYQVRLQNGYRVRVDVFVVYDNPEEVIDEDGGISYKWPCITRRACCKTHCQGPVLRTIQRFGKLGRRSGSNAPKEKESEASRKRHKLSEEDEDVERTLKCLSVLKGKRRSNGVAKRQATGKPLSARDECASEMKNAKYMFISIDEAGSHVKVRHFRLVAGMYVSSDNEFLGSAISAPIRVLANNDVPTGAAFIQLQMHPSPTWVGWTQMFQARLPDSMRMTESHSLDSNETDYPQTDGTGRPSMTLLLKQHAQSWSQEADAGAESIKLAMAQLGYSNDSATSRVNAFRGMYGPGRQPAEEEEEVFVHAPHPAKALLGPDEHFIPNCNYSPNLGAIASTNSRGSFDSHLRLDVGSAASIPPSRHLGGPLTGGVVDPDSLSTIFKMPPIGPRSAARSAWGNDEGAAVMRGGLTLPELGSTTMGGPLHSISTDGPASAAMFGGHGMGDAFPGSYNMFAPLPLGLAPDNSTTFEGLQYSMLHGFPLEGQQDMADRDNWMTEDLLLPGMELDDKPRACTLSKNQWPATPTDI